MKKLLAIFAVIALVVIVFNVEAIEDVTDDLIDTRLVITGWPENPVSGHVTWQVNVYYQSMEMSGTETLTGNANSGEMLNWSCDKIDQPGAWGGSGSAPIDHYTTNYLRPCWINDPAGAYILKIDVQKVGYEPQHYEKTFTLNAYEYMGHISTPDFPATVTSDDGWNYYLEFDAYYQSPEMSGSEFVPGSHILVGIVSQANGARVVTPTTFPSGHIVVYLGNGYVISDRMVLAVSLSGDYGWQGGLASVGRTVTVVK
jgi:hypothetical protein